MKYGLLIIIPVLFSCNTYELSNQVTLDGKWVEINTKTDTLTFGLIAGLDYLTISRGKEIRGGSVVPGSGSGPYAYKLHGDKISLRWDLSANNAYNDYPFYQFGDKIVIGNFYEPNSKGALQTFKKLN